MLWSGLYPSQKHQVVQKVMMESSSRWYYQDPIEHPPFGLSDHASIELQPKERAHVKQPTITIKARDLRPSKRQAMGTYLDAVDVCTMTCALETCTEKVSLLELIITTGLDHILPIQSRKVYSTENPLRSHPHLKNWFKRVSSPFPAGIINSFRS